MIATDTSHYQRVLQGDGWTVWRKADLSTDTRIRLLAPGAVTSAGDRVRFDKGQIQCSP